MREQTLVLGAGLAGLSASFHIGHEHCAVLERKGYPFGHSRSEFHHGFTWDEGPHVSFTKSDYVKDLFAASVAGELDEYEVKTANFYKGSWIDHPAQSNLYQVPEPLRSECLRDFLKIRSVPQAPDAPADYADWLERAFGKTFANTFSAAYTRKYWTIEPADLTIDWIGSRVYQPSENDVRQGFSGPLPHATHYITRVRYPRTGGYQAFGRSLAAGANIRYGERVVGIDLLRRRVQCENGRTYDYDRLISTLPLPSFVKCCVQATPEVLRAAERLSCTQLLLVNVEVPHLARRPENWLYVYDEDMYSTRISFTEKLTRANAPENTCGIQVEVYFSSRKPLHATPDQIARCVVDELYQMKLIDDDVDAGAVVYSTNLLEWANVMFDHATKPALDDIFRWLETLGMAREPDDTLPTTDWSALNQSGVGNIVLAGRFGQWKYYWTDDCVLRGQSIAARCHL